MDNEAKTPRDQPTQPEDDEATNPEELPDNAYAEGPEEHSTG